MKRGAQCLVQTINLSKPKTCVKPEQIQKLVSADVTASTPASDGTSKRWIPRTVTVKVCTRRDMRRSCPPKLCDCSEKEVPLLSTGEKFRKAFIFLVKSTIVAGLIYWTHSEGVWSDNTKTEDLYYRMLSTVAPSLPRRPDVDDMRLPQLDRIKYSTLEAYNHAVLKIMDIIVSVPLEIHRKLREILFPCDEVKDLQALSKPSHEDVTKVPFP